jgi:phage shock protein A
MAGFFQRIFSLGEAEAHSIIDKLEDPVKMTEQGIRELKQELEKALKSFAEVKAISIRAQRDMEKAKLDGNEWEKKAMALLQQGQSGKVDMKQAEFLATEALNRKNEATKRISESQVSYEAQNKHVLALQKNIDTLKSKVQQYENELVTLKARAKTASATSKINKQLANVDSSGTLAMLERMKEKVEEEENLAQAYGDMAQVNTSVEDEINQLLTDETSTDASEQTQELAALKAKMGIQ